MCAQLPEASWPARVCTCVDANGTATNTWALIQDPPRPQRPPAHKLSTEDGDQGAFTWLPRPAIRLASCGPAPPRHLWAPHLLLPLHPLSPPQGLWDSPLLGRRKLVRTLAEQNNLFFLLRNKVLEPQAKVTTWHWTGTHRGPVTLSRIHPWPPASLSSPVHWSEAPAWGSHTPAPGARPCLYSGPLRDASSLGPWPGWPCVAAVSAGPKVAEPFFP